MLTEREQNNYFTRLGLRIHGRTGVISKGEQIYIRRSFFLGLLYLLRSSNGVVITHSKAKSLGFRPESGALAVSSTLSKSCGLSMREFAFSSGLWFYNSGGSLDIPARQQSVTSKELMKKCSSMPKFTFTQWKHVKTILIERQFRSAYNCWIDKNGYLLDETKDSLTRLFLDTQGRRPSKSEWKAAGLLNFYELLNRYHRKYNEKSLSDWLDCIGVNTESYYSWITPKEWPKVRSFNT
jgi:hypothetical protein